MDEKQLTKINSQLQEAFKPLQDAIRQISVNMQPTFEAIDEYIKASENGMTVAEYRESQKHDIIRRWLE